LVVSWILGGILITIAAWILGHIEQTVGVSPLSYALALFIAFILILVGGLVWITVASSVSKHG
jgi:type VI protein secretion system component VasK